METFFTAQRRCFDPSASFHGHPSCCQWMDPAGVARSMSMLAPLSFMMGGMSSLRGVGCLSILNHNKKGIAQGLLTLVISQKHVILFRLLKRSLQFRDIV